MRVGTQKKADQNTKDPEKLEHKLTGTLHMLHLKPSTHRNNRPYNIRASCPSSVPLWETM